MIKFERFSSIIKLRLKNRASAMLKSNTKRKRCLGYINYILKESEFSIYILLGCIILTGCAKPSKKFLDTETIIYEDSFAHEYNEQVTEQIESTPQIWMNENFNPTLKVSNEIKNHSLKELFKKHFVKKVIEKYLNKKHANYIKQHYSRGGYIDLRETGPIDPLEMEYIMGGLGKSSPKLYLIQMNLESEDRTVRHTTQIPKESDLAKVYFMQDIKGFCIDNQELVTSWVEEMSKEFEETKTKKAKSNQSKYLQ